ncbi:MAG: hypothetical protein ACYDBH_24450 [Acidobacteriaceae bacterium]
MNQTIVAKVVATAAKPPMFTILLIPLSYFDRMESAPTRGRAGYDAKTGYPGGVPFGHPGFTRALPPGNPITLLKENTFSRLISYSITSPGCGLPK